MDKNEKHHGQPSWKVSSLPVGKEALASVNLGSEFLGPWWLDDCPHRYYPRLKGSTETQKTFEKDTKQLQFLLVVLVFFINREYSGGRN